MRGRLSLRVAALVVMLGACSPEQDREPPGSAAADTSAAVAPNGSGFDFYVLSLSWSPSYCAAEGEQANGQQCRSGRPYAFVVHGLWPQFERGYPEFCGERTERLDGALLRSINDLVPSAGLIRHQWNKHGTCSGLDQDDYFRAMRLAREHVVVPQRFRSVEANLTVDPAQAEADFRAANPGLPGDGIAVTCDKRYLREVRICLSKALAFRSCPEVDRRSCQQDSVVMPPVRGG